MNVLLVGNVFTAPGAVPVVLPWGLILQTQPCVTGVVSSKGRTSVEVLPSLSYPDPGSLCVGFQCHSLKISYFTWNLADLSAAQEEIAWHLYQSAHFPMLWISFCIN